MQHAFVTVEREVQNTFVCWYKSWSPIWLPKHITCPRSLPAAPVSGCVVVLLAPQREHLCRLQVCKQVTHTHSLILHNVSHTADKTAPAGHHECLLCDSWRMGLCDSCAKQNYASNAAVWKGILRELGHRKELKQSTGRSTWGCRLSRVQGSRYCC
jgi:hypothetical protein